MMLRPVVLFSLLTLFACNLGGRKVLPQEKMVELLTDIAIVEAGNGLDSSIASYEPSQWKGDYAFVFRKYGADDSLFRSSYRYYFNRPEQFSKIMEQVITNLQSREANQVKTKP
jgi:hypothetical protein